MAWLWPRTCEDPVPTVAPGASLLLDHLDPIGVRGKDWLEKG
jgi:hypothetical protein